MYITLSLFIVFIKIITYSYWVFKKYNNNKIFFLFSKKNKQHNYKLMVNKL